MPTQYISTDPNAGKEDRGYLSTDPSAGSEPKKEESKGEHPHARVARLVKENLPAIGATAAGLLTGGAGFLPAIGIAALGGGAGKAAQMALDGSAKTPFQAVGDIATEGGIQGVLQGVGGAVSRGVGNLIQRRAVPMVRSALKQGFDAVRRRAGVEGMMPSALANAQAKFIIDRQLKTPEAADALVKQLGGQIDETLAGSKTPLDTATRIPRYMQSLTKRVNRQALPAADRAAVESTAREVVQDSPLSRDVIREVPKTVESSILDSSGRPIRRTVIEKVKGRELRPNVTPSEGMDIARMTSNLSTKRAWGSESGNAGAKAAEKTLERAVRDSVKTAVPETRPLLHAQGRAMDARTALDRASWRDANRDQIGMGGLLSVAQGRPLLGLLLQAVKEGQLSAGLAAGRVGPKVAESQAPSHLLRAIRSLFGTESEAQE